MVRLWTRQHIKSLDELKEYGVIRIKREHLNMKFEEISDYVANLYSWFVEQAEKKVPRPEGVEFPVWCSVSEENMMRPIDDEVVFVIEVNENDIIYFDGAKWDYVLNHHYVPKDEKDEMEYAEDIAKKGFANTFSFLDDKTSHLYPEEKKRVMESWHRIFDIDKWDIFRVQANIWEIRPEMIKEIIYKES
ncbi:DUF3841 domain-containing protein [Sedimentibacter sp.]|uniref:DUF3841 domain-containing protein n=1 Tax=Sedimentibacter sp. TaxID=1960295 RepID=UPI00289C0439|nr:DUF3841 domain-containing protein [Sedimentibacter sp.]